MIFLFSHQFALLKLPRALFSILYLMNKPVLFFIFTIAVSSICDSNYLIPGLQTGQLELQGSNTNNIYVKNFENRFKIRPSAAVGLLNIGYDNAQVQDFYVKPISVSLSSIQFQLKAGNIYSWKNIKINFWVTDRPDLVLGNSHIKLIQLQGKSISKYVTTNSIPNYSTSIVRPFLNGFSLNPKSSFIDLLIEGNQVKENKISFKFTAGPKTDIKQVWFSYIIFSPSSTQFASYGGLVAEISFSGNIHKNIRTILHYTENIFSGLTKLKADLSKSFAFTSGIDTDFVLSYENSGSEIDFYLSYLVAGLPPNNHCSKCSDKCALDDKCVKTCPIDTYPVSYRDKGIGCQRCSPKLNEILNPERTGCIQSSVSLNRQTTSPRLPFQPIQKPVKKVYVSKSCQKKNSYWTGYRCACKAGYFENRQLGTCEKIKFEIIPSKPSCSDTQYFNGATCICKPKHTRNSHKVCVKDKECPPFSVLFNGACICIQGYKRVGNNCVKDGIDCPQNTIPDGKGGCKCKDGFYLHSQKCIPGKACPPNSYRADNGECKCSTPYYSQNGQCVRCPDGQFRDKNKCVHLCGIYQEYSYKLSSCVCKDGYGIFEGKCDLCPSNYFLKDGYCVCCPLNSEYDQTKKTCICQEGYQLFNGICKDKCSQNEVFISGKCKCFEGLGKINGECKVCPGGSIPHPISGQCSGCGANEYFSNGKCICSPQYGKNSGNKCVNCEDQGLFLLNGYCASCPQGKVWDGTQSCICPPGYNDINGFCAAECKPSQLIDQNGKCYYCPLNQIPENGVCTCQQSYSRHPQTGRCQIVCKSNQHVINGICGTCSLNSEFDSSKGICICPPGFYRNNFGYCEKHIPPRVTCDPGSFYDDDQGCTACKSGCRFCQSLKKCTVCALPGYKPSGGFCVPKCGDGIKINGLQSCDDGNTRSGDGCSSKCQIESLPVPPPPSVPSQPLLNCGNSKMNQGEKCDDGNQIAYDGCSQSCQIQTGHFCDDLSPTNCFKNALNMQNIGKVVHNSNNVFLTVKTTPAFVFNSQQEMRSFIKYSFTHNYNPASAFCNQRIATPELFDCLFIYPSGVPLAKFYVELSFNKNGNNGYISLFIDTTASDFSTRSLH